MGLPNYASSVANGLWESRPGRAIAKPILDDCKALPVQCNPLTYGGVLASAGTCLFCRGNSALPATERMKQFLDLAPWRRHLSDHFMTFEIQRPDDPEALRCPLFPLPQCEDTFKSAQEFKFHLQNIHCAEFVKASKGSKPADDLRRSYKMANGIFKKDHEIDTGEYAPQVYEFVDQSAENWNHKRRRTSKTFPTANSTHHSMSVSTAPTATPTLVDWTSMTELVASESQSETYMPGQPAREDICEYIDPSLLSQPATPPVGHDATALPPCQSFVTVLSRSSSHEAYTTASDRVIEIEDQNTLKLQKSHALKPENIPLVSSTAPSMY